ELQRGHADALTERRVRRLDVEPRSPLRTQNARSLARKRKPGLLAEAKATQPRVQTRLTKPKADLQRANVRALREDLRRREPIVQVGVVDDDVADLIRAVLAVDRLG